MSAIPIIYTESPDEGAGKQRARIILVAADGLSIRTDDSSRIENEQKIFRLPEVGPGVGYGVAGSVRITSDTTGEMQFNLAVEVPRAAQELSAAEPKAAYLQEYAETLGQRLFAVLKERVQTYGADMKLPLTAGKKAPDGNPDIIAVVLLFGYVYGDVPEYGAIILRHQSGKLMAPVTDFRSVCPGEIWGYLSDDIAGGLFSPQHRLYGQAAFGLYRKFRKAPPGARSLDDAIKMAAAYFLACKDPEIMKFDVGHCNTVGGLYHAAKVTPTGFEWVLSDALQTALDSFKRGSGGQSTPKQ